MTTSSPLPVYKDYIILILAFFVAEQSVLYRGILR